VTPFGHAPDGRTAQLYRLENSRGFRAEVTDYGATLVRLLAPDARGEFADVVLGFDRVEGYAGHDAYFGATIGRCANRIAAGRFTLDGRTYSLAQNNHPPGGPCHLHGGRRGFDRVSWSVDEGTGSESRSSIRFRFRSVDGEEGYPGNLDVEVTYGVTEANALRIEYRAAADRPTPVNLTNHSYFNLAGEGAPDALGHMLTVAASQFVPIDAGLVPKGGLAPVGGTPLDFRAAHRIGDRIDQPHEQLRHGAGYDHCFVLDRGGAGLALAATAFEPGSGRRLEVHTTEPGVQLYTANFLNGSFAGKKGHRYGRRSAFCLETEHFPDSPNRPEFPPVILRPGETFSSVTEYRFSAQ